MHYQEVHKTATGFRCFAPVPNAKKAAARSSDNTVSNLKYASSVKEMLTEQFLETWRNNNIFIPYFLQ